MTGQTPAEGISLKQGFAKAALGLAGLGSIFGSLGIQAFSQGITDHRTIASVGIGLGFTAFISALESGALSQTFRKAGRMTSAVSFGLLIGGFAYYASGVIEESQKKHDAAFQAAAPIQPGEMVHATARDLFCKNSYKGEKKIVDVNGQNRALVCP